MRAKKKITVSKSVPSKKEVSKFDMEALERLRKKNEQVEKDYERQSSERGRIIDKHRRDVIASLYAVAMNFKQDGKEWKKFCKNPYWKKAKKKPKTTNRDEALRHVIHYFHQTDGDKNAQKQASKHFKLLEPFFDKGASASKVRSELENGVENLRRKASGKSAKSLEQKIQFRVSKERFDKLEVGNTRDITLRIISKTGRTITAKIVKDTAKAA